MSFYKLKNFFNAQSVEPGDVFVCTIKVMVDAEGVYRVYRCRWPDAYIDSNGMPDGDWHGDETLTVEQIFPIIATKKNYEKGRKEWEALVDKICDYLDISNAANVMYEDKNEHDAFIRALIYKKFPDEPLTAHDAQAALDQWRVRCTSPCGETCTSTDALEEHLRICQEPECNGF